MTRRKPHTVEDRQEKFEKREAARGLRDEATKTPWIKRADLTPEQQQAIADRRFGAAHPSNWPTRPQAFYRFHLVDGDGYSAGDVAGWGENT
jgi:hypothetical protein